MATELSEKSRESAQQFAQEHGLSLEVENALAQLLEDTWQDGCLAERTFQFLEGLQLEKEVT